MIYLQSDFYSNFSSMVESNDEKSLRNMFVDQISNLIAYKKSELVNLFNKIGLKVSKNPTNKELSTIIGKNIGSNKKLQVGLSYLIAEENGLLQQEIKKSRQTEDAIESFEGENKKKKPIDWNKSADAVTAVSGALSVLADSITQAKSGDKFIGDLDRQSNVKSPEEIKNEREEVQRLADKRRRRNRNIVIGVLVTAVVVTVIVGFKKGWFKKQD